MNLPNLVYNPDEISIYIHWPFCLKKCPYCDFNSYVAQSEVINDKWLTAYLNELKSNHEFLKGKNIKSIFFGGGTPSLMNPDLVFEIINQIQIYNKGELPKEITLEANPSSFETQKFKNFRDAGVNRLSIGGQSFNDNYLKFLGREHSKNQALYAINQGNEIFSKVSFDLINGLPNQSINDWSSELDLAIPLIKSHVSIYELTIEPGTAFYRDNIPSVDESLGKQMFEMTVDKLTKHNIYPYEVSNFAKNNEASIHNLNYWRGGLYLGIGPGAHSRLLSNTVANRVEACSAHKNPQKWLKLALNNQSTLAESKSLNVHERVCELILSNLRLYEPISSMILPFIDCKDIDFLKEQGFIDFNQNKYRVTSSGRLVLNSIIKTLVANLNL